MSLNLTDQPDDTKNRLRLQKRPCKVGIPQL